MQNTLIADAKQVPISTMVAQELCTAWLNRRYIIVYTALKGISTHSIVCTGIQHSNKKKSYEIMLIAVEPEAPRLSVQTQKNEI